MMRIGMRKASFGVVGMVCLAVLAIAANACGNDTGTSNTQPTAAGGLAFVVTISDNKFTPSSLTVPAGTTVVWNWTGENSHAVLGTFDSTAVKSPTHKGSGTFSYTFTTPGTYAYQCAIHGAAMAAKVVVK
ncbi:MAG: cupredoxin domain-containing protein [Tepidiformaceae bacterium]